jgi:diadenylate cyclase
MQVSATATDRLHSALARVAPGTGLREGLDRIVRAKTGALVVLGAGPEVLSICSGGFLLDAEFSPPRLSELAKMDGAIILTADAKRIARANVHLVPDPTVATTETGTRHRTAERVARSRAVPVVVSISEEMGVINLYAGDRKHQLQEPGRLLDRANQALQTLERYKARLDDALHNLTALEVEDVVMARDVTTVLHRGEMVRRINAEIETMIVELGVDARLLRLQLDELFSNLDDELDLVSADYPQLAEQLLTEKVAEKSGESPQPVASRGLRLLARVPRLEPEVARAVTDHVGELAKLQRLSAEDLAGVDGVDLPLAAAIKETLDRLTESSILQQYS